MPQRPPVIFGINPGTRYLALAVFQGLVLIDWRIKLLKGKWSREKVRKAKAIIAEVIDRHDPTALAIKDLHPSRSTANLRSISAQIEAMAERRGIAVRRYSIEELKACLSLGKRSNKRDLAEAVVSQYPDLFREFEKEKDSKNPYHIRMFEAVALGLIFAQELDNH